MSKNVIRSECRRLYKSIRASADRQISENAYFLLPRLKQASDALSYKYDEAFKNELEGWLKLREYTVAEAPLCSFLRKYDADDDICRKIRYYIILCFCQALERGEGVLGQFRESEKLDYGNIYKNASAINRRMLLCRDFAQSDGATQALYRKALSKYAKKQNLSEYDALRQIPAHRLTQQLLEQRSSPALYILLLVAFFILGEAVVFLLTEGIAAMLLSAVPVYMLGCALSGVVASRLMPPHIPARLGKSSDLPPSLTVITTVLDADTDKLFSRLEKMYFTEHDCNNAYFGILSDLPDNDSKYDGADDTLIKRAEELTERLNVKYGNKFFFFVRDRRYSVGEGKFIAHERKRGAICELVKQMKGEESSLYITGDKAALADIPYLLTLDSDTLLYPGSLSKLLRCAAHPLNKPVIDRKKRIVVKGHGILQPRIGSKLLTEPTLFSLLFSPSSGTDAYHSAGFDVYSAVFGRGSFCGKGLIDVDAFYTCCCNVFPDGRILSHDAIEGCRCRCGAVTDVVLYEGTPKNALSYYKRLHRWIRGDIQSLPFSGRIAVFADKKRHKTYLCGFDRYILTDSVIRDLAPAVSLLCIIFGLLSGLLPAMSIIALSYTVIPGVIGAVLSGGDKEQRRLAFYALLCRISFFFKDAQTAIGALITCGKNFITGRHMLAWTTAKAADKEKSGVILYIKAFLPSLLFGLFLIVASRGRAAVTGTLTALSLYAAIATSSPRRGHGRRARADRQFIISSAADMMKYYDDLVNSENSYLPPDNFQTFANVNTAHRTSPTNIGLYLISVISAADMGVIEAQKIYEKLKPTLTTLTRMPKSNGLLYNWYDTRTLSVISGFVSTVDCGNYFCCLISLYKALTEYSEKDGRLVELVGITETLISEFDISSLYDESSGLFYIGHGDGSDNKYDLYESEMHATDIAAIAYGMAPPEHLSALGRPVVGAGASKGIASWSGTAFEYFMPSLFLPTPSGSLADTANRHAAAMQRAAAVSVCGKRLYGRSESCYYGFDSKMNYQYKAHGVNALSLCADSDETVLSPYSLFLMLGTDKAAEKTLKNMKQLGFYGKYGFYEAIDLTKSRVGSGYAVIRCFMAHHIGMSIVAAANYLCNGINVRRFCSDPKISSVLTLLYEKFPYERPGRLKSSHVQEPVPYYSSAPYNADCAALSNTALTVVSDNYGTGIFRKGICICRHDAGGIRGLSLICRSGRAVDLIRHPSYFGQDAVIYSYGGSRAKLTVCGSSETVLIDVDCEGTCCALSFEPILSEYGAYLRHPAYSSVFITGKYNNGILIFQKRGNSPFCIATAAYDGNFLPLKAFTRAEDMHEYKSVDTLLTAAPAAEEGACVEPHMFAIVQSNRFKFMIGCGTNEVSAVSALFSAVADHKPFDMSTLPPIDEEIFCKVLGVLMRPRPKRAESRLFRDHRQTLYKYGVSADKPVILIDATGKYGVAQLRSLLPRYAQTVVRLLICGIPADTVVLYDSDDSYFEKNRSEILRICGSCGISALIGDCFFIVKTDNEEKAVWSDVCAYRVSCTDKNADTPQPAVFSHDAKIKKKAFAPYFENGSAVIPAGLSYAHMSFVYANPCFGTLVSDRGCGFCWYANSRMMKLTAHDTTQHTPCETVSAVVDGERYDLFRYAEKCVFHPSYAQYYGKIGDVEYTIKTGVDGRLPYKTVEITSQLECDLIYSCIPVLAEARTNGAYRYASVSDAAMITNVMSDKAPSLFLHARDSASSFDGMTLDVRVRHKGDTRFTVGAVFSHTALMYMTSDTGGAIERYGKRIERFLSPFKLHTSDRELDMMFNMYAPYQALICRQFARTGFYQNGGAYGFRDQLQDSMSTVYGDSMTAKAQIVRCAAHQYEEGDVMHWFHPLTNTGIRSRCSDDMLWLIVAVHKYIRVTNDRSILSLPVRYLSSAPLGENENDRYEKAVASERRGTVLEHCAAAAGRIRTGAHGLCLFGGGDWNDGMNEAGIKGVGESVWLTLFAAIALRMLASFYDDGREYEKLADELLEAVCKHGFADGQFIRGYLDSAAPFGIKGADECETDILPQAFAAFAGLDPKLVKSGLNSAYDLLFDKENGVFKLFSPPFDNTPGIGYISSYPPGIRENGGQYTHGAVWGAMGYLAAGEAHKGYEILRALLPMKKCRDIDQFLKYGREPYVLCGDVYSAPGLQGHGGWSWYTGAAGWYYTAVLEYLLGYKEHDGGFEIRPSLCADFSRFSLKVDRLGTEYTVNADKSRKNTVLDGKMTDATFFVFDGGKHTLDIGDKI